MVRSSKYFIVVIGLIVISMLLAGCRTGAEAGAGALTTDPADCQTGDGIPFPVEQGAFIVFSGWGDPTEQQIYRDSIARFQEHCPTVQVDYQPIPADYQTKMMTTMVGGTAADVFYVDAQLASTFGPTGQILALDDVMAEVGLTRDMYMETLLPPFTYDGSTYALPKDWGTLGIVYLPGAFEAAGIEEPTPDWGWEDLHAAAKAISEKTDYAGFCMAADASRFAPFLFQNGGSYANEELTESRLGEQVVIEAGNFIMEMKDGGSLIEPADVGASWCGEAIGKELVAMTYEGGWMVNTMKLDYPDVVWKAQELPGGPVGKGDIIFTNGIAANANGKYPRASAALTMYITGPENQEEIVKTGFAYSTHVDQADMVVDPNDLAISKGGQMEYSKADFWGPNTGKIIGEVSKAMERIYLGANSVEESFAQADENVKELLDQGNE